MLPLSCATFFLSILVPLLKVDTVKVILEETAHWNEALVFTVQQQHPFLRLAAKHIPQWSNTLPINRKQVDPSGDQRKNPEAKGALCPNQNCKATRFPGIGRLGISITISPCLVKTTLFGWVPTQVMGMVWWPWQGDRRKFWVQIQLCDVGAGY